MRHRKHVGRAQSAAQPFALSVLQAAWRARGLWALTAVGCVLSACSFDRVDLWPDFGSKTAAKDTPAVILPNLPADAESKDMGAEGANAEGANAEDARATNAGLDLPDLGQGQFRSPGVTQGAATGTEVGKRVESFRAILVTLQGGLENTNSSLQGVRSATRSDARSYYGLIAGINSRLQLGSTPGNPELVAQWNQAQKNLSQVGLQVNRLDDLANATSEIASQAAYLLDAARATYALRGALEEDHRQLAVLEDEANQTVVIINRLLGALTEDIARTRSYYQTANNNLGAMLPAIDSGQFIGANSLSNLTFGYVPPEAKSYKPEPARLLSQVAPLMVIRFERDDVDYQKALYDAVSQTLDRRPEAVFDLVAVAPGLGPSAQVALASSRSRSNAEEVMRSLASMGMPYERISLSAVTNPDADVGEVRLYLR